MGSGTRFTLEFSGQLYVSFLRFSRACLAEWWSFGHNMKDVKVVYDRWNRWRHKRYKGSWDRTGGSGVNGFPDWQQFLMIYALIHQRNAAEMLKTQVGPLVAGRTRQIVLGNFWATFELLAFWATFERLCIDMSNKNHKNYHVDQMWCGWNFEKETSIRCKSI